MSLELRTSSDGYASGDDSVKERPGQAESSPVHQPPTMSGHRVKAASVQERIKSAGARPDISEGKRKVTKPSVELSSSRTTKPRKKAGTRKVRKRRVHTSSSSSCKASSSSAAPTISHPSRLSHSSLPEKHAQIDRDAVLKMKSVATSRASECESTTNKFYQAGGKRKIIELRAEIKKLEAELDSIKDKKGSKIRSRFPGGKKNNIEQQLESRREALLSLEELERVADSFFTSLVTVRECDLQLGLPVRTEIPGRLSGGTTAEKFKMQRALLENIDELRETLIMQIPKTRIDLSRPIGEAQTFVMEDDYQAFNNYIIHLDMHPGISYDQETNILTIPSDDTHEKFEVKLIDVPYEKLPDGREILNVGDKKKMMCDQAAFSEETFKGQVRMAAFNDGCGWGEHSRGAALKANEVALTVMESGIQTLIRDDQEKPLTSREIIRIHDSAILAAHTVVASALALGSTCPQIMTVAGDIAHLTLVGDTKCFVIGADMSVRDPTEGIRGGQDPSDPGGRIGGFVNSQVGYASFKRDTLHGPDLRNYSHCLVKLLPGDTVVMCSDGIADNIDPEGMGLKPSDDQFPGIYGDEWDNSDPAHVAARNKYQARKISDILRAYQKRERKEFLTREDIANALNQHVQDHALRYKALAGAGKATSSSAKAFPGKPDHAGMLIYTHPRKARTTL